MSIRNLLRGGALLASILIITGCGGGSTAESQDAGEQRAVDATETDAADTTPADAPDDEIADNGAPIMVTSPKQFATVVGSMQLAGFATAHEGTLNWAIHDADGKPFKRGHLTASCGAPCRGEFAQRVSLKGVPLGSWELHVWEPNVADEGPARLNNQMIPITVSDQRIEGAPEPDAHPPGGVPAG